MANNQTPRAGRPPHRPRTATAVRRQQRRQQRRRMLTSGVAIVIVALIVLALVITVGSSNDSASSTSSSSSSSTAPTTTMSSAAGKPCVAVKGPLPKGAPSVPVQLGKPPATLVTKDLKVGTGAVVKATQTVSVDYIGVSCSTGKIFDSSYSRGQAASFPLNKVIKGWTQGIAGMKVGGERLLGIPPALGYGATGSPPDIAPNETLWFVVHVISAK